VLVLEYVHAEGKIHRHVKPENVLLQNDGYIKLSDFGLTKKIDASKSGGRTYTLCGTPEFMAPEIVAAQGYAFSVDWYALGVTMYELITGHTPFYNENNPIEIFRKILSAEEFNFAPTMDRSAKKLINSLTRHKIEKRMGCCPKGISKVKSHNFFSGINWEELTAMKKETVPNGLVEQFHKIEKLDKK
jgi:protein kinase A